MTESDLKGLLFLAYAAGRAAGYYGDDKEELKKEHGYSDFYEWYEWYELNSMDIKAIKQ